MREHRRFGGVDRVHTHRARFHALEQLAQPVDVERLVQRVVDGLAHDHVVGDLDGPGEVVLARSRLREHRGHQVVGFHALDRRRVAAAAAEPQHQQRAVEVPAPSRDGTSARRARPAAACPRRCGCDVPGDFVEREAVVRAERQHDRVVARGGLQLEVERAAELLAQREPERAVDAPAVRRVDDELHAAGLVEEALDDEILERGHDAEHRAPDAM